MSDKRIISALIMMISIFGLFAFVLPSYGKIKILRQAVQERKEILADRKALLEKISSLAKEIESGKSNIDKLGLLIPAVKSIPEIISTVENTAAQAGLALIELRISEDKTSVDQRAYKKIGLEAKMAGSYPSSVRFLELLEQNIRLIDVHSAALSELPGGGSANLSVTVKFDTYYLK